MKKSQNKKERFSKSFLMLRGTVERHLCTQFNTEDNPHNALIYPYSPYNRKHKGVPGSVNILIQHAWSDLEVDQTPIDLIIESQVKIVLIKEDCHSENYPSRDFYTRKANIYTLPGEKCKGYIKENASDKYLRQQLYIREHIDKERFYMFRYYFRKGTLLGVEIISDPERMFLYTHVPIINSADIDHDNLRPIVEIMFYSPFDEHDPYLCRDETYEVISVPDSVMKMLDLHLQRSLRLVIKDNLDIDIQRLIAERLNTFRLLEKK